MTISEVAHFLNSCYTAMFCSHYCACCCHCMSYVCNAAYGHNSCKLFIFLKPYMSQIWFSVPEISVFSNRSQRIGLFFSISSSLSSPMSTRSLKNLHASFYHSFLFINADPLLGAPRAAIESQCGSTSDPSILRPFSIRKLNTGCFSCSSRLASRSFTTMMLSVHPSWPTLSIPRQCTLHICSCITVM